MSGRGSLAGQGSGWRGGLESRRTLVAVGKRLGDRADAARGQLRHRRLLEHDFPRSDEDLSRGAAAHGDVALAWRGGGGAADLAVVGGCSGGGGRAGPG